MSKIALKPNASGTGVFSLEAPNSNVDRTLTLPDEEGTVATIENIPPGYEDQDALDLFNVTGSAPVYACRAWVNFDGGGPTIRDSGNVSSITDNGTGLYTVNLTVGISNSDFAVSCTGNNSPSPTISRDAMAAPISNNSIGVVGLNVNQYKLTDVDVISVAAFSSN